MELNFIQRGDNGWCIHEKDSDDHIAGMQYSGGGKWVFAHYDLPQTEEFGAENFEAACAWVQKRIDEMPVKTEEDLKAEGREYSNTEVPPLKVSEYGAYFKHMGQGLAAMAQAMKLEEVFCAEMVDLLAKINYDKLGAKGAKEIGKEMFGLYEECIDRTQAANAARAATVGGKDAVLQAIMQALSGGKREGAFVVGPDGEIKQVDDEELAELKTSMATPHAHKH